MSQQGLSRERIQSFFAALGAASPAPGTILVCGGTSAVLEGWREATIDIDLAFIDEPQGFFEALQAARKGFDLSIDLLLPTAFVPALPGADQRHVPIGRYGKLEIAHYDFYGQALSKILRSHPRDLVDVRAMAASGRISGHRLRAWFAAVQDELLRYPAIEAGAFAERVATVTGELDDD